MKGKSNGFIHCSKFERVRMDFSDVRSEDVQGSLHTYSAASCALCWRTLRGVEVVGKM